MVFQRGWGILYFYRYEGDYIFVNVEYCYERNFRKFVSKMV